MINWINSDSLKNGIIVNSKITRLRNVKGYKFPHKISEDKGRDLIKAVESEVINSEKNKKNFKCTRLWQVTKDECVSEIEKQIITRKLVRNLNKSAYILNKNKTIAIMINEEEHINIQCLSQGLDLEEAIKHSNEIDNIIEKRIGYSFSEEFGYLTSNPMNVGSGFKVSIMMHLQSLLANKKIELLRMELSQIGISMREIYMKSECASSGFYIISNQMKGDLNEKEILNNMRNTAINLAYLENNSRQEFYEHYKYETEDQVLRSFGILKNSRMISYDEALEHTANIRLGISLNIINEIKYSDLNNIMVNLSDYSVSAKFKDIKTSRAYLYKRAEFIRKIIND